MPVNSDDSVARFGSEQSQREVLRFITCGSVDDGKSTLLGRLLHESKNVFEDQMKAIERESETYGTQGAKTDLALLLDGLQAEREQGITIDVAYRFFATARRRFISADTPGHEQYTRNMATGASTAALAIILVDARKKLLRQTFRHSRIVALMGLRDVILAVNKMDLIGYDEAAFTSITEAYRAFAESIGLQNVQAIPVSALAGDNVVVRSERMAWYTGPSVLDYLDTVTVDPAARGDHLRMPVQFVNRPDMTFRGFCGRVVAGHVQPGDRVRVEPSGVAATIKDVLREFGPVNTAAAGDSITLTFTGEVDVSRGDVIVAAANPAHVADQFEARILWMADQPAMPGRSYLLKLHTKEVTAAVTAIKFKEDIDTGAHLATKTLVLNDVGRINLSTSQPIVFEPYAVNRSMGGFILIDKLSFETVAAGMIDFALRRASNIHWQALEINKSARAAQKHQHPRCIWFTGLSGSGKSTIANLLEKRLHAEGRHTYVLDGDNVRHYLNRDLGFTEPDRVENIRRVAEVARLMVDAGLVVLVSCISPYRAERAMARALFETNEFVEAFVDAPIEECARRDPKGLYSKAKRGELANFTGIDSAYEAPEAPEVHVHTDSQTADACVEVIMSKLESA